MSSRPLVLALDPPTRRDGFVARIADLEVWSEVPLVAGAAAAPRPPERAGGEAGDGDWQLVSDGEALDLGARRRVRAWRDAAGRRRLDFEDGERWIVAGDVAERRRPGAEPARALERALGAPLALALAGRGVFLLHASALANAAGAVALAADSGVGKSTIAAAAAARTKLGFERIADDLLPVRLGERPEALPRFPQLKLPPDRQYAGDAPERLALAAVVELERVEAATLPVPALEPLDDAAAALALVRATAAARLFDGDLLAAHLAACAAAATRLRVARLRYPSGLDRLGEALERLAHEPGRPPS